MASTTRFPVQNVPDDNGSDPTPVLLGRSGCTRGDPARTPCGIGIVIGIGIGVGASTSARKRLWVACAITTT